MHAKGPQLPAPFRGHPPQIHMKAHPSQIHTHVLQTYEATKWHTLCNWLRIRAHGVLLNLWRLCILRECGDYAALGYYASIFSDCLCIISLLVLR